MTTAKKTGKHAVPSSKPRATRSGSHPKVAPPATLASVLSDAFAQGFYVKGKLLPEHTDETQLKLAFALVPTGVAMGQLNALALAVRAVGDAEPFAVEAPLSAKQKTAFGKLAAEKGMPAPFKQILAAAQPALEKRRDLYALYGVLSGTMDKLNSVANTMALADELGSRA